MKRLIFAVFALFSVTAQAGQLYAVNGALYWRGSAGTVTMVAPQ